MSGKARSERSEWKKSARTLRGNVTPSTSHRPMLLEEQRTGRAGLSRERCQKTTGGSWPGLGPRSASWTTRFILLTENIRSRSANSTQLNLQNDPALLKYLFLPLQLCAPSTMQSHLFHGNDKQKIRHQQS